MTLLCILRILCILAFSTSAQKNDTLVSGNPVDEKKLHPGGRNFFINLIEFLK